ncbi:ATP-binding protein [Cohnella soli]|uniref:ATP-binding protein n=1 Tax=Cohnella soli TaxID=425005 RepID=A0ABW0HV71_9BACL
MKWMKKLRLINWHYFSDETMEFGKQTLITGPNGAGKSTIIDALQVIFIADQRLIRFNPAAHDEAKRTLTSYLRGKIGSDDRTFLRDGDFTTYIAAEFFDDDKRESFVIGTVIDVFRDGAYDEEYYIIAEKRLDEMEFVKLSGELRNREEFRRLYYTAGAGHGISSRVRSVFERSKSNYQKALLQRMGGLHERFFSSFLKALSFKPIHSVRDFVYENILDERELQLALMKQNFDIHENYQRELEELQLRRDKLIGIREKFEQFVKHRETVKEQDYVIRRLKVQFQHETAEALELKLRHTSEKIARAGEEKELAGYKREAVARESQEAYQRWQNHAAERRKRELEEKIQQLEEAKSDLERKMQAAVRMLRSELSLLEDLFGWIGSTHAPVRERDRESLQLAMETVSVTMGWLLPEQVPLSVDVDLGSVEEAFRRAGVFLSEYHMRLIKAISQVEDRLETVSAEAEELRRVITDLENRKITYPASVDKLRLLLVERLGSRSKVRVFCEEMELEDEAWRDAAEGYLNTQRFDLLVDPPVFAEALSLYERDKFTYKLEGVGLVDTEKESRFVGTAQADSIALLLRTDDPVVQAHVDHLLGNVIRADNEQELRKHRTSVTRTCMVYSNLTARQMTKDRYRVPYIGSRAIARQLEIKREELEVVLSNEARLMVELRELNAWSERLTDKQTLYGERLAGLLALPNDLQETEVTLKRLHDELERLDMAEAVHLKAVFEDWVAAEKLWNSKQLAAASEEAVQTLEKDMILAEQVRQASIIRDAESWLQVWMASHGAEALQGALTRWEEAERQQAATESKIMNWEGNWKGNQTRRDQELEQMKELRRKYNYDYSLSADIADENNHAYDSLLHDIEHLNIPEYQEKVAKSLQDSEEEFKSHFVFKLREAIETARREFHVLNFSLRNFPFSADKYHFEVTASEKYKRFYDAIMDPQIMERGSLFELANEERSDVLHELFELLVRGEAGDMDEFTDYRRYLDFDMIVQSGETRYRFSQVLKEKSGGETQTPFYIAILASFHHLYTSGKTIRLVVFDEAFNKMDEQRIQTSLRLIKQLKLQLIASVPDEKMQHMAPEVTTTLIVNNRNHQCFVDMIDRWEDETQVTADAVESDGVDIDVPRQEMLF